MKILEKVWMAADYPWSVRLKEILRLWLPWIRARYSLTEAQEKKLLAVSPSTINRTLRDKKRRLVLRLATSWEKYRLFLEIRRMCAAFH
jgi:hypothetical protein